MNEEKEILNSQQGKEITNIFVGTLIGNMIVSRALCVGGYFYCCSFRNVMQTGHPETISKQHQ